MWIFADYELHLTLVNPWFYVYAVKSNMLHTTFLTIWCHLTPTTGYLNSESRLCCGPKHLHHWHTDTHACFCTAQKIEIIKVVVAAWSKQTQAEENALRIAGFLKYSHSPCQFLPLGMVPRRKPSSVPLFPRLILLTAVCHICCSTAHPSSSS